MNETIYAVASTLDDEERKRDRDAFFELRRERGTTDAAIESSVGQTTAERLAAPFHFVRRGVPFEAPLWWLASQLRR